jgi:hypothetical protein
MRGLATGRSTAVEARKGRAGGKKVVEPWVHPMHMS